MNDLSIELNEAYCDFGYERNEQIIWGSCSFTMRPELHGHFEVSIDNIVAYFYAGETEVPYILNENEIDAICEGIFDVANDLCLWEKQEQIEREYWDELNADEQRYGERL